MLQRFHTLLCCSLIDVHLHFIIKLKEGFAFQLAQSSAFQLAQSSAFLHLDLIILFFQDTFLGILDSFPWTTCLHPHQTIPLNASEGCWTQPSILLLYMVCTFLPYHKYLSLAPFLPCLSVSLVIFSLFRECLLLMS